MVAPAGPGPKKFVFDSNVVVPAPSGRLSTVPTAPTVSAKAMTAPPWRIPGTVHISSRTVISASTRSGVASRIRIPSISGKNPTNRC